MELASFSARYGAFYVPAFVVKADGRSLTEQLEIAVSQVEVDLSLGAAGRFSFNVVHAYDQEQRTFLSGKGERVLDILKFGAAVQVGIGYGDRSRLEPLISGVVTELSTSFPENGSPELSVSGYDPLFNMTLGKRSFNWKDASDSDVVEKIAKDYNLTAAVQPTQEKHAQIEQNQESDYEFIKKLAARNHYEFYVDAKKTLHFARPDDRGSAVVTLKWGEGLLAFKPEANLAAQVSAVEVYGWDPKTKERIVGKAVAGEESGRDARRQSGGERLQAALGKAPVLQIRQPVFTQAEAKERAKAILNEHAKKFVTGEADCIGLPEVRPDRNVTLDNLGTPFSKTYYVEKTTHKADSSGYRMKVKVKDVSL